MFHYRLKCVISNIVEAPQYVTWYLNSKVRMMMTMMMILYFTWYLNPKVRCHQANQWGFVRVYLDLATHVVQPA